MKKILIIIPLLCTTLFSNCQQMQNKKLPPVDLKSALITIDDCGVSYKGRRLPFGKPLKEWEIVLGQKSSRANLGMFDELGLAWEGNANEPQSDFYIFFTNLDSPEGKAGKLSSAGDWRPWAEEEKDLRRKSPDLPSLSEGEIDKIKEDQDPKNFFYPFKTYQGLVNIQGAPVKGDMDLQTINAYREQHKELDIFTFWDRNVNGKDETLTTKGDRGEYFQITDKECDGKLYRIVLFFTDYKLEYIRVSNLSKSEMETYDELRK